MQMFQSKQTDRFSEPPWDGATGEGISWGDCCCKIALGRGANSQRPQSISKPQYFAAAAAAAWTGNVEEVTR